MHRTPPALPRWTLHRTRRLAAARGLAWCASFGLAAGALLGAAPAAAAEPAQYAIFDTGNYADPLTENFAARSPVLPINRTWAELGEADKAALADAYEALPPGDEPPYPAEGLQPIFLAIAKAQTRYGARGRLELLADVNSTGVVTGVTVLHTPGARMGSFASSLLALTRFKPAVCHGQPCKMQFPLTVSFDPLQPPSR